MRIKLAAILVVVAAAVGGWFYFRSRVVNVWVYTDYAFRFDHANWPDLVASRFAAVNRIYQRSGAGVSWKVLDATQTDPVSQIQGIDNRRANMVFHQDRKTDVYVIFTGVHEGNRTGSVSPFTNVAMVVDFADKSESLNANLLAHELAHLFGEPSDPSWYATLMAEKPESSQFTPSTANLIHRLRNYPFALGIDGLTQGSWEKKALSALADTDSGSHGSPLAHAHTVLGTALLNERKKSEAVVQLKAAVQADPGNASAHLNLAEAYSRDGQENLALEQTREVARIDPDKPLSHRALGAMLGRTHQPEEAVQELRIAARMEPQNSDTQVLIGTQLAAMYGHLDDAIAAFQEALRVNPDSPIARQGLERAQLLKDHLAADLAEQRAAVARNPNDPDAHYRLGKAEAYTGDLAGAIRDFQKSADLRPDNGTPHAELAQMYFVQGNVGNAWDEVRKARALGTEPPPTLISRLPPQK